jgi:hypothetical protein
LLGYDWKTFNFPILPALVMPGKCGGMVGRFAGGRGGGAIKSELGWIKRSDECVDDAHPVAERLLPPSGGDALPAFKWFCVPSIGACK